MLDLTMMAQLNFGSGQQLEMVNEALLVGERSGK